MVFYLFSWWFPLSSVLSRAKSNIIPFTIEHHIFFLGEHKERTNYWLAWFFFFLFINDINLVRSQGEKEQQQQNIHRDNQIKEKESGQAYLILHADTLLILKCAVALCVTGSNYRRRKKLELRSAPCSTRQRLNDVLSKRWFNRNVFARMRFVYIAAADRPIYLLVGIKIEYKKKMQKN